MKRQWNEQRTELSFETTELKGILVADCGVQGTHANRHCIKNMFYKPTKTRVTPENSPMEPAGSFTLFRAYARNSWLTELRATKPNVIPNTTRGNQKMSFGVKIRISSREN